MGEYTSWPFLSHQLCDCTYKLNSSCYIPTSDWAAVNVDRGSVLKVHHCHITGSDAYGFYLGALSGTSNQHDIAFNIVSGTLGAYALYVGNGNNHRIVSNHFSGSSGYTINTEAGDNMIFANNTLWGDASYGYALRIATTNSLYVNNVVVNWTIGYFYDTGSSNILANNETTT